MQVTATEAKNRFGAICALAKAAPVFIEKDGRIDSVIVSARQFEVLSNAQQASGLVQRKKRFEQTYKAWLQEQNSRTAQNGLWCDDLRVW